MIMVVLQIPDKPPPHGSRRADTAMGIATASARSQCDSQNRYSSTVLGVNLVEPVGG